MNFFFFFGKPFVPSMSDLPNNKWFKWICLRFFNMCLAEITIPSYVNSNEYSYVKKNGDDIPFNKEEAIKYY